MKTRSYTARITEHELSRNSWNSYYELSDSVSSWGFFSDVLIESCISLWAWWQH